MAKYVYPAIFTKEGEGYCVTFPDIESCFTCGDTLSEAIEMAEDALCLVLIQYEKDKKVIPTASSIKTIQNSTSEIVSLVHCDTIEYRKLYDNKTIKKTLTIPNWLNTLSEQAGINFSATLQEALKSKLNIED